MSRLTEYMLMLHAHWQDHPEKQQAIFEIPDVGRDDLAEAFRDWGYMRGVEVGTEYGEYAEVLLKANPNLHLTCVDPYLHYADYREHTSQPKLDDIYQQAQRRLAKYEDRCSIYRMTSTAAAVNFKKESLDFVYLDGNHSLPYVISDLHAWVPKVRKGGIVSGHDYIRRNNSLRYQCHVVEGVNAWCQSFMVRPLFILGTKDEVAGQKRETIRSWMFVKE